MRTAPAIEAARFRQVMSHFCSGIIVVTACSAGEPVGLTCQSFTALSLDPPLVSFNVARTSRTWPRVRAAGSFSVNILGAHQDAVSRGFAVSGADKFAGLDWSPGDTGSPLLAGALATVECRLHAVHDGGDHEIVVGRVVALATNEQPAEPLLYYRSQYRLLGPA